MVEKFGFRLIYGLVIFFFLNWLFVYLGFYWIKINLFLIWVFGMELISIGVLIGEDFFFKVKWILYRWKNLLVVFV